MYEVELKVRADHGPVRRRLSALDAEPLGTVEQADTYYGHPVRDFAETDEALRIRRETCGGDGQGEAGADADGHGETGADVDGASGADVRTLVTYKGPLVEDESKTREELETGVEDGETMAAVLAELGFEAVETVEKTRERYRVDGYTVTLDTVEELGEFLEVETQAETVEPAREGAVELLRGLELDPAEQVRTSYLGLLLEG
jgi:adenylate cyclase class 2